MMFCKKFILTITIAVILMMNFCMFAVHKQELITYVRPHFDIEDESVASRQGQVNEVYLALSEEVKEIKEVQVDVVDGDGNDSDSEDNDIVYEVVEEDNDGSDNEKIEEVVEEEEGGDDEETEVVVVVEEEETDGDEVEAEVEAVEEEESVAAKPSKEEKKDIAKPQITDILTCGEEESVLVKTHGRRIGRKLLLMAEKNLCLSFKQLSKFSLAKDKVMTWVHSRPEEELNELLYGAPNRNNYAVALNDEHAYLHVYKNGGTTVNRVTKQGHTKNADLENRKLFTTVRDPIDHFLSGWAECGYRSENPDEDPAFTLDVGIDQRIESWMDCVKAFIAGGKKQCTNCAKHSFPQANFMLNPDEPKWIHPSLEMVGDLKELGGMLEIAGFAGGLGSSHSARSASDNAIKVQRYPNDRSLLSDKTLQLICEFVKLDYFLFDFEPPQACVDQLQSDMSMIEKSSS